MKINGDSVHDSIAQVELLLAKEKHLSPALKAAIKLLIVLIRLLTNKLKLTSKNSSVPPSDDKKRKRGSKKPKSNKKQGGQNGHPGTQLKKDPNPDKIKTIKLDKRTLPKGIYHEVGYESRQVLDIQIKRVVTEYRAQILVDQNGKRFVAPFPGFVKSSVQYGTHVKADSVYLSQFQLPPYQRIQDQFADQMRLPLSTGSVFNFNQEAYNLLGTFAVIAKKYLIQSQLLNLDETGINVDKKRHWLHVASNDKCTYFYPHTKRGTEAIDEMGILTSFKGVMCHDHWKPYFRYDTTHALCNAHHLRELIYVKEEVHQQWAGKLHDLLLEINQAVNKANASLKQSIADDYRKRYRCILQAAEKECPAPVRPPGKKGRLKKTKARNLLERLRDFENETLLFMEIDFVPFTNNQGENVIRMTKVQQKISGCFRSMNGAHIFCRVRSYLSTCRKNGVNASTALNLLFEGKLPDCISDLAKI